MERLGSAEMEDLFLDDIWLDRDQALVTMDGIPDTPGVAAQVFDAIQAADVFVDMIVQSYPHEGVASLSFTVPRDRLAASVAAATRVSASSCAAGTWPAVPQIAKLSVSGIGLRSHTGVAIRMFHALSEAGINVELISTSEVRVNVVVDDKAALRALSCLETAFADVLR